MKNNYVEMRNQMRLHFLSYDQNTMIRKFRLDSNEDYLYLDFLGRNYRISRKTGIVDYQNNPGDIWVEGDYNESMTIYDVLCCSRDDCSLSGNFALSGSLKGIIHTGWNVGGGKMFTKSAAFFNEKTHKLPDACRKLGGSPEGQGDVAYRIPLFSFLPILFVFWRADDEFPPEIKIFWDTNVLDFLHYETLWFAAGHLMKRLEEEIKQNTDD